MKTFNQFVTEMQNRESPFHGIVRPSGTYPKNLPYIRQPDKELDLFKSRFKMAKLSDDDINKLYKDKTNPKKPPEKPIDPYSIPVKKA